MKMSTKLRLTGGIVGILSVTIGCVWFGWKIVMVIFLMMWANNMEFKAQKIEERERYRAMLRSQKEDQE